MIEQHRVTRMHMPIKEHFVIISHRHIRQWQHHILVREQITAKDALITNGHNIKNRKTRPHEILHNLPVNPVHLRLSLHEKSMQRCIIIIDHMVVKQEIIPKRVPELLFLLRGVQILRTHLRPAETKNRSGEIRQMLLILIKNLHAAQETIETAVEFCNILFRQVIFYQK